MNTTKCQSQHEAGNDDILTFDADQNEWYCPECNQVFVPTFEETDY